MPHTKTVETILPEQPPHWVGDGFPVRSVFSPGAMTPRLSPFILLDYAEPRRFEPSREPRGVGPHPHRGFETVTVVYDGELVHRDSVGNSGDIGPGDVQWMTAASGLLHEEMHSPGFTERGGMLEMAQLWVNLPAAAKRMEPRYQTLRKADIPSVPLADGAGAARLIAGSLGDARGAATTVTPVILWDARLSQGAVSRLPVPAGFTLAIFVRSGRLLLGEGAPAQAVDARRLALLDRPGADAVVRAESDSAFLVLGGQPINEPVVSHGPFVMNTDEEVAAAIHDFRSGRFGQLD